MSDVPLRACCVVQLVELTPKPADLFHRVTATLHGVHGEKIQHLEKAAGSGFDFPVHVKLAECEGRVEQQSPLGAFGADHNGGVRLPTRSESLGTSVGEPDGQSANLDEFLEGGF